MDSLNVVQSEGLDLLKLKKEDPILVPPAKETPKAPYFLSIIDHQFTQEIQPFIKMLYSFKSPSKGNEDVFQILKESLSRVLVEYYPLAGRMKVGKDGKFFVDCNGLGSEMVEALADCDIEELGDLTNPNMHITSKLIHVDPEAKCTTSDAPLSVQVTKFNCGGFTLGVAIHHCWVDGNAATQFVNSWSETTRRVPLSIPPFLDRQLLKTRTPPKPDHELQELMDTADDISISVSKLYDSTEELQYRSFNLTPEKLEKLKVMAAEDGSIIKYCTTFEVCAAFIWRARTKVLGFAPDQEVRLVIAMDARSRLKPRLPKGYFGNGVLFSNATCKSCDLVDKPLPFAVSLVQHAITNATDGYLRSALDQREVNLGKQWPPLVATMLMNSWARFPFYMTDFGWGETLQFCPVKLTESCKDLVAFLPDRNKKAGIEVLISFPTKVLMSRFEQAIEI